MILVGRWDGMKKKKKGSCRFCKIVLYISPYRVQKPAIHPEHPAYRILLG